MNDHNEQQRAGITCVRCARVPLTPTMIADTDLVRCADEHARICTSGIFWLTTTCPSWCGARHDEEDGDDDRTHLSRWEGKVPLVLEDAGKVGGDLGYQPEHVTLYLVQGVRESAPRIWCGKGETSQGWHMTPAEAGEMAAALVHAADLADSEAPGSSARLFPRLPQPRKVVSRAMRRAGLGRGGRRRRGGGGVGVRGRRWGSGSGVRGVLVRGAGQRGQQPRGDVGEGGGLFGR